MNNCNKIVITRPIIDMVQTGQKIKSLRKFRKLSVRTLQCVFGMENPQSIYNWESGKNLPSIDNLLVLAQLFDVSLDTLIVKTQVEIEVSGIAKNELLSA